MSRRKRELREPEPYSEEEEPVSFSSPATTPKWQYCVSPAFWCMPEIKDLGRIPGWCQIGSSERCQQIGNFAEALFLSLDQEAVLGYWINSHIAEGYGLLV
ncbi:unnamed protein product [Sphagnum balticum]